MISAIGLVAGLALLIWLTMRGVNILIAAPACALLVAVSAGMPVMPPFVQEGESDFATTYMAGFTGFFADWFLMFLLGAIFGKLMEETGAAESVAHKIVDWFGPQHAVLAVVAACAVLTYGGVSVFIVAFGVYPMAVGLFRQADLPRRFIPAALTFGSVTFTMTSAGSPEIQNIIPVEYLNTTPLAGWEVSIPVAIFMAVAGHFWLRRMVNRAVAAGERFHARDGDREPRDVSTLPNFWLSLAPLVVVLGVFVATSGVIMQVIPQDPETLANTPAILNLDKWSLVLALGAGCAAAILVGGVQRLKDAPLAFSDGSINAVIATANTCAVVGFGAIARETPAFQQALQAVLSIPGSPLIGAAIAVTVIAGLTGSASGGQTIALPLVAPHYTGMGVDPGELHRVVAISSGALDSLPHNGYVVTTIRSICGETHHDAYGAVGRLTVVVPILGVVLAVVLFALF